MFVDRTDVATLRAARRMDDGRLVAEALITRPGVFEYPDPKYPGGIRRELRPDDEVYSRATMDSLASVPCTPGHPPKLLDSTTAKAYMVGSTGERVDRAPVTGQPDWLKTTVMIADAGTIKRMDAGDNATSCGYKCLIEEKSGVDAKYGRYDVIQRSIRGNHLAVAIPAGRAGELARVRMDDMATYADLVGDAESPEPPELIVMTTSADGHQHTLDPSDSSGCTSGAYSDGADTTHRHEWVRAADGTITIGENAGHTHAVDSSTLGIRGDSAGPNKFGVGRPVGMVPATRFDVDKPYLGGAMDPEKLKETVRTLEAGLKASEKDALTERSRADSAESERDVAKGQIATLEKEVAGLKVQIAANASAVESEAVTREKTRADAAEAKVSRFDETFVKAVRDRTKVMHEGATVLGVEFRMDDMSDRQIKCAVVKRLDSTADVSDGVPEGVITGMYEQLLKRRLSRAREDARVSNILGTETRESPRADSVETRVIDYRNQWKKPLSELIHKKGA